MNYGKIFRYLFCTTLNSADDDYVFCELGEHYRSERLIKQIIKNRLCTEFVAFLKDTSIPDQRHLYKEIRDIQNKKMLTASTDAVEERPAFKIGGDLLQMHFKFLYMVLEPRDIADELFQEEYISINDHDDVTFSHKKHKRFKRLSCVLKEKKLYLIFCHTLKSKYSSVWDTMHSDIHQPRIPSEEAVCIQHNFTTLQTELPKIDVAKGILKDVDVLDCSNISDIDRCRGVIRQKSKLIKIILMKGMLTCKNFVTAIETQLKRTDLVQQMKRHNDDVRGRGKPGLLRSLDRLRPSCLQEHQSFLLEELEPLRICDLLFQERAVDIFDHDKITETTSRRNQVRRLIDILKENKNDCFHYFLYILHRENYDTIIKKLENPALEAAEYESESDTRCEFRLSHTVTRLPGEAQNETIEMQLMFYDSDFSYVEEYLYQRISSSETFNEEVFTQGQMGIEQVSHGSIVIRLRPISDQAVQNLLNAKENNKLLEIIGGILKQVYIEKVTDKTTPMRVRIQVIYSNSASKKPRSVLIKDRVDNYKDELVKKLEPKRIDFLLSQLLKSKVFHDRDIESIKEYPNCYKRIDGILSLVTNGSSDDVDGFATALKDLAYFDILELIDPQYIRNKAERIRKIVVSNFENILDEMQMTLAMETLSECTGDVEKIKKNILPRQGTRKQRMQNFLRFILLDDHNLIVFEKMLERNGLGKILKMKENVRGEDITSQNIAVEIMEDPVPVLAEGLLFESVITLFYTDCPDELTVRRLFVFLKENLILDTLRDEFIVRNFFPDNESKEYVFGKTDEYYRGERFLKLLIKKKRCKEFVACMHDLPSFKHVLDKILKFQKDETKTTLNVVIRKPKFTVTNTLLQNHFGYLFIELEPRRIADEMFQAGFFSISDHDDVTDLPYRHKRLKRVLEILERKHLHAPFTELLESLHYTSVLETLQTERQFIPESYNAALCLQHNFTFLLKELPDQIICIMEHMLTHSDLSDITQLKSVFRQKAKLLKIILRNRGYACKELFKTISSCFKRDDLIQTMETKSTNMLERGRPVLVPSLDCQQISCLRDHKDLFEDELEPIKISDLLFEERAVDILTHDRITEIVPRRKQIKVLLDTLIKNENDCFHIFLFILQNHFETICNELKNPTFSAARASMFIERCSLKYEVARAQGDVQNKNIKVHLSVSGRAGSQIEHELFQRICSDDPDILEEVISHGQMDVDYVTDDPVVLQLKPLTDDAVHTLLNAKANNRLLKMVLGILKTAKFDKQFDTEKSFQIRVQVHYAESEASMRKTGISRTMQIINLLKVHRNELLYELEPTAIISALLRSKAFQKRSLHSVGALASCNTKINDISSMVEVGSTDDVVSFVATLKDLGYGDIVDLIDPPHVHAKAEDIRKFITSNYKNILDEMQITLANETLSMCIGNINDVRNKISRMDKSRHQRMNDFLRFIVQDDCNVIEFARVLKNNGFEELLRCKYDVQRENILFQDVEMTVIDDYFPPSPDGVLFDSVITLANGDKAERWAENIKSGDLQKLFGSFCIEIPEDPERLSFTKDILGESKLAEFVEEIKYLARSVVLYKYLRDEEKKPGTVYVYEVIAKYIENQIVIEEKDAGQKLEFFKRKNEHLVKVILIKGGFHSVLQAKKKVYQKYKLFFNFERFHLQHESEQYTEVAKLSAHQKVLSFKQFIESVRESIPLQNIENIVKDAVNRALSKERITELCFDAFIQESGNINSDPYYCNSSSTVERFKQELMSKTVESVSKYLGSEICSEIKRHIETKIQSKFIIDTDSIATVLNFSSLILLETMLTVIASILNPLLGALCAFISVVGTVILAVRVNVNSRSWRRNVANEIYKQVDENKERVLKELSSNIRNRCRITTDHLKMIAGLLEEFRNSIHLNRQDTRLWEES